MADCIKSLLAADHVFTKCTNLCKSEFKITRELYPLERLHIYVYIEKVLKILNTGCKYYESITMDAQI